MVEVQTTKVLHVPRDKAVAYFSNAEEYFSVHSKHYKSFRIVSASESSALVDEEWDFQGRRLKLRHRITLNLPHRMDLEIVSGEGLSSKESIIFEEVPEGTRVRYISNFVFSGVAGKLLGWLARKQIRQMIEKMAEEDRAFLEGGTLSANGVQNSNA